MGAEKFFNIKCRKSNLNPDVVVLVATVRALKMHGGLQKEELKNENIEALKKGVANLKRHINNIKKFGLPVVVAINQFISDTKNEISTIEKECKELNVEAIECSHWTNGGEGATSLAKKVVELAENNKNSF